MRQEGSRVQRAGKAQLLPCIGGHQDYQSLHGVQDEGCRELVGVVGGLGMIRFRNALRNEGQLWETIIRSSFLLHFKRHPAVV